jgi:hypothetical protein
VFLDQAAERLRFGNDPRSAVSSHREADWTTFPDRVREDKPLVVELLERTGGLAEVRPELD